MTRPTRSDDAARAATTPSGSGPWAAWPWSLQDAQVDIARSFMDVLNKSALGLQPSATLEAWNAAQAKFAALWIDQLQAWQASWLELAKLVPGARLMPGQFSPEALFVQWTQAWKPAHTEDVVA